MPSPRRIMFGSGILIASLAVLMGAQASSSEPDALPGSALSLCRARKEARFIVVAEVVKTADVLHLRDSGDSIIAYLFWTELKPSAMIKGKVDEDELNRRPLSIQVRANERIPRAGEEFIVFIGDAYSTAPITKMLPKTDENLAAIETAKPDPQPAAGDLRPKGGIGGGGLGGGGSSFADLDRAMHPGRSNRTETAPHSSHAHDAAMRIVPDPKAAGAELVVQTAFAAAMARDKPKSRERAEHFAWLDRNGYVRHYVVQRVGWYGHVTACDPRPEGGWRIKAALSPQLCPGFGMRHCFVTDAVEETYEFVDGEIRMIESNAEIAKPDRQHFPVAF